MQAQRHGEPATGYHPRRRLFRAAVVATLLSVSALGLFAGTGSARLERIAAGTESTSDATTTT